MDKRFDRTHGQRENLRITGHWGDALLHDVRYVRFSTFAGSMKGLSFAGFQEQFPEPFLLIQMMNSETDIQPSQDLPTLQAQRGSEEMAQLDGSGEVFVTSIKKATQETGTAITIGRAGRIDILIPHISISRKHACILFDKKNSQYFVMDVGSANGSFLNNEALMPHEPMVLTSGATVLFGRHVLCTFLLPQDMYGIVPKTT